MYGLNIENSNCQISFIILHCNVKKKCMIIGNFESKQCNSVDLQDIMLQHEMEN